MRPLRILLTLGCLSAATDDLWAGRATHRLTPANAGGGLLTFTVRAERVADGKRGMCLRFRVRVAGKEGLPARRVSELAVCRVGAFVCSCPVRAVVRGGEASYTFEVAADCASKSTFSFYDDRSRSGDPHAGILYWFYLEDFVGKGGAKADGPGGGAQGEGEPGHSPAPSPPRASPARRPSTRSPSGTQSPRSSPSSTSS